MNLRTFVMVVGLAVAVPGGVGLDAWAMQSPPAVEPAVDAAGEPAPGVGATRPEADDPAAPDSFLRPFMPDYLKGQRLLTLEYWQWLTILVLILLGLAIDLLVRLWIRLLIVRLFRRQGVVTEDKNLGRVGRPIGLLAAAIFWIFTLPTVGLVGQPELVLSIAVQVIAVLAGMWAAWRITDVIAEAMVEKAAATDSKFDDVLVPLVRKTLKIFIVVIGVIYVADALKFEIGPLLAGLGIGGLAFGLAAKDTIENFFGSVAVLLDRPFSVGDWVKIDNTEGIVEEVGFRSTRVRTFYNSLVTVPNATLVRAVVDNYGLRKYRRWSTHIGVQYDTPPEKLIAFTEGIREIIRSHPYTRKDYFQVYMHEFGASSLNLLIYVFWEVDDWSMELRERQRLFVDIVRLADRLGVQFAFPTQTIHLYQEDRGREPEPRPAPKADTETSAAKTGIRQVHQLLADQPWRGQPPGPVEFKAGPTALEEDPGPIEDRTAGG